MKKYILFPLAFLALQYAEAITITVNTTNDELDAVPNANTSLREAIVQANAGDTINFDPALSGQNLLLKDSLGGELIIDNKEVSIDASALADPVTIKHTFPNGAGRLMNISNNSIITIEGVILREGDEAGNGGAIHVSNSTLNLIECEITDCSATDGGGIFSDNSSLSLTECSINNSEAFGQGGGIYHSGAAGSLVITDSSINFCEAIGNGGGVFNNGTAIFDIIRAGISRCQAANGAGLFNTGGTQLRITRASIAGNRASEYGGGIYNESGNLLTRNTTIAYNTSLVGGGIHLGNSSTSNLNLTTISGNASSITGGGINLEGDGLTLRNSVIAENEARRGGDIYQGSGTISRVEVNFVGNNDTVSVDFPSGSPNINGDYAGTMSSPADPLLGALGHNGGGTESMHPLTNSPLIDNAGAIGPISLDQRGSPRPNGGNSDLGAVEVGTPDIVTTNLDEDNGTLGAGSGDSLREVLSYGTGEWVAFDPSLDGSTLNVTGPLLVSGSVKIIDASNLTNDFIINGGDTTRLLEINSGALVSLINLTFTQGFDALEGGAILVNGDSQLSADECIFSNNNCGFSGAAVIGQDSEMIFTDCTFLTNTAQSAGAQGGAIYSTGILDLRACTLTQNQAIDNDPGATINSAAYGGAIYFSGSGHCIIQQCTLDANVASGNANQARGGGIYCTAESNLWLIDSTISNNFCFTTSPISTGAGIHSYGEVYITGCTFHQNTVTNNGGIAWGGGMFKGGSSLLTIINSTFNANEAIGPVAQDSGGALTIDSSEAHLIHVTIADNISTVGVGGIQTTGNANIIFENCIVAGGDTSGPTADILKGPSANISAMGLNFIGDNSSVEVEFPFNPPLIGSSGSPQDPLLGPLQNNSGFTMTMAPLADSATIDAAIKVTEIAADQRLLSRPRGPAPDLGAYETGNSATYEGWANEAIPPGNDNLFNEDANGDNIANGLKYATGMNALGMGTNPLTIEQISPTQVQLCFAYNPSATDILYSLDYSNTLQSFNFDFIYDTSLLGSTNVGFSSVDINPVTRKITCIRDIVPGEGFAGWRLVTSKITPP